jgi:diguanylate cyclase (GGDEF)-like protein
MGSLPSSLGVTASVSPHADRWAAERRVVGRVAGIVILLGALIALAAARIVSDPSAPSSFYLVSALSLCSGVACLLIRWDKLSGRWLHAIPVLATVEVAAGVRFAGVYGDIAANYYIFVVVFVGYAFSSRQAIAAHLALVLAASSLPVLYLNPNAAETVARALVGGLVLVVVAGIVTLLREGLQQRQRELEELAVLDPLTGIGNYRLLTERLEYEIARHRRSSEFLTVMLLDLDGFKEVNDTFGHLVGDSVLCTVADALSAAVRSQDTLARQGGDEFSILAPDTSYEQAARLATRARDAVGAATSGSLTVSVGWVTYPTHAQDPSTLLALADAALRRAKRELPGDRRERPANTSASIA